MRNRNSRSFGLLTVGCRIFALMNPNAVAILDFSFFHAKHFCSLSKYVRPIHSYGLSVTFMTFANRRNENIIIGCNMFPV